MDALFTLMSPATFVMACGIAVLAGVIKGTVGFAMPTILISGLSSLISPELALAGLIIPTLLTNGWQALRQGFGAAWQSVVAFRRFLFFGLIAMGLSAQMVPYIPSNILLLLIGFPIVIFSAIQFLGWGFTLKQGEKLFVEPMIGAFAGFIGGMSGIWGPPTVAYLNALDTPKRESVRIQGVIYGLGAIALFGAHLGSGVVRAETLPFALALVPAALLGMWFGLMIHDRIDQSAFRKATQVVLVAAGLNLIRRGLMG